MKCHRERLVLLPFSMDCVSLSSIAVGRVRRKKPEHSDTSPPETEGGDEGKEKSCKKRMKKTFKFFTLSMPRKPNGWHNLVIKIKTFSRFFVFCRDDRDGDEEEEEESEAAEIVIGFPTDVKHLTHIGLDGKITTAPGAARDWEPLTSHGKPPPLPSLSLKRFELDMTTQATVAVQPPDAVAVQPPDAVKPLL